MPWIEFKMYLEYMSYIQRWKSGDKESIAKNKMLDAKDKAKYGGGYDGGFDKFKKSVKQHHSK